MEIFDFYKQLQSIQYPLVKQVPEDQIDIFVSCGPEEQFRLFVVTPQEEVLGAEGGSYEGVQVRIGNTEAGALVTFNNIK